MENNNQVKRIDASPEKIWKSAGEMVKEVSLLLSSGDVHYHWKNPLPLFGQKLIPTQMFG